MARPKSDDKRLAMLNAATLAVGVAGTAASTALIARNAGVAEGTLFRYFVTKDTLLNALYIYLKQGLCEAMLVGFDRSQDLKSCTRHIWGQLVRWGLANPQAHQAMRQLAVSDRITCETHNQVEEMYPVLRSLAEHCIRPEFLTEEFRPFVDGIFFRLAETTMEFASQHPQKADVYIGMGFEAMWRAVSADI